MIKRKVARSINRNILPSDYKETLQKLKERIRKAQIKASLRVNEELLILYWDIGKTILEKQKKERWGAKTINRIARDLKDSFPGMSGFSLRNLSYMRQFAEAYPKKTILQQLAAKIPWGHNMVLIDRIKDSKERLWYVAKVLENGWSRDVLETWIDSDLYSRQGKAITNFSKTMDKPYSDLAHQTLKDPYCFNFLEMTEQAEEKDIEQGLVNHIRKFLTELGMGFAFVGRQYRLEVEGEEFFVDLLFYHFRLRRFIVVELKNTPFKPEYAGKMSFYLAAIDATLKHPDDKPSMGMILCRKRKKLIVEYALQDKTRPMGVAVYKTKIIESLPKELKPSLPTIEQIEAELSKDLKK